MAEHQARLAVDQEHLLYAKEQAVHHGHFAEGLSGTKRFDAPLEALPGKAVLESGVEGFEHAAKGFRD